MGVHVYWKHTLETLSFGNIICIWKQKMYIGNMHWILETKIGYWKHKKAFGNIICILETSLSFGNTRILETYNERSLTGSHVEYTIISRKVYDHSTESIRSAYVCDTSILKIHDHFAEIIRSFQSGRSCENGRS